jgi:hypothetical protein
MQPLVEPGSRHRRHPIGAAIAGAALVAIAGLAAAHFAGYGLPFGGHSSFGASSEAPSTPQIGGPMISTQILEHPTRADHPARAAGPAIRAPRHDIAAFVSNEPPAAHRAIAEVPHRQPRLPVRAAAAPRPQLAMALIRPAPAPRLGPPIIPHRKAPALARHVVASPPLPPPDFARPRRLMTPAELCAQTDRPERCLRGIYRERHGDPDDWGPGERGRGHGYGWRRHWGHDEDDGDEGDDD